MTSPRPRRRWLQFRLRSLIALMLLVCLASGWWAYQQRLVRRERLALEAVQRLQEKLTEPEWHWIEQPLEVETRPLPWWLALSGEEALHSVQRVSFDLRSYDDGLEELSGVTDRDLQLLAAFPRLQSLVVPRSKITDDGLAVLRSLKHLTTLDLSDTQVTDKGLAHLRHLPALESLVLDGVQLQGEGLKHLAACRRLRALSLWNVPLQDGRGLNQLAALESLTIGAKTLDRLHLHGLPELRQLTLGLAADEVDLRIEQLPQLQEAQVWLVGSNGPGKLHVRQLPVLKTLALHLAASGGDSDALEFHGLPALRECSISGKELAVAMVPQMRKFPSLQVLTFYSDEAILDDAAVRQLTNLPLKKLHLEGTQLTDEGLQALAAIRTLNDLSLRCDRITEQGVAELARLPRLTRLILDGVRAEVDLGPVCRRFRSLETLGLQNGTFPALTIAPDHARLGLSKLNRLILANCQVETVRIDGLPALTELSLGIPQTKAIHINDLAQLRRLDISLAQGQTIERFTMAGLPQLGWLSLQCGATGANMPEETFEHLLEFPRLKSGIVWGLNLPEKAKSDLKRWEQATGRSL